MQFRAIISDERSTWCDRVAAHSHLEYLKQVETQPQGFCGRKVLAAILLKKKQKKGRKDLVWVVSLGTGWSCFFLLVQLPVVLDLPVYKVHWFKLIVLHAGNRTILSAHLEMDGKPVNDCHAELIARRALVR